jgi:hypothetical protein
LSFAGLTFVLARCVAHSLRRFNGLALRDALSSDLTISDLFSPYSEGFLEAWGADA